MRHWGSPLIVLEVILKYMDKSVTWKNTTNKNCVGPVMYCMWRSAVEIFPRCQSFVRGIHWLRKWRTKCLPVKLVDRMNICVDSSPPSATYLRRDIGLALVSIMTFYLLSTKPLSKQMLCFVYWTLRNKLQWNSIHNAKRFIHDNAYENIVCEMAVILSKERWVKSTSRKSLEPSATTSKTQIWLPINHAAISPFVLFVQ